MGSDLDYTLRALVFHGVRKDLGNVCHTTLLAVSGLTYSRFSELISVLVKLPCLAQYCERLYNKSKCLKNLSYRHFLKQLCYHRLTK